MIKETESNRSFGSQGTVREVGHGEYVDCNTVFLCSKAKNITKGIWRQVLNIFR